MVVRPLEAGPTAQFALLPGDRMSVPALDEFIDAAEAVAAPARPVLRAVA
jgi:hypothetical protein